MNVKDSKLTSSPTTDQNSSFSINLNVDFNRKIIILTYYNYADLISYLGGVKSAIMPAFNLVVPLVILYYLLSLTGIIQQTYTFKYKKIIEESVITFHEMLSD